MAIISLLTDFGNRDGFVGVMKGVIWGISAGVQIADISHEIQPQNILHGALILGRSWKYFPEGSIHVAVVDPGVGTHRQAIAARVGGRYFVAPDNGLITIPWEEANIKGEKSQVVVLDRQQFWLPQVSRSFHGRDIFAPVAAHIANGVLLEELGTPLDAPVLLPMPQPVTTPAGWRAQIVLVDVFGNLVTNLSEAAIAGHRIEAIQCAGISTRSFVSTFGEASPGDLVGMIDSSGWLSLCVVNGSAAEALGADIGDPVEVVVSLR